MGGCVKTGKRIYWIRVLRVLTAEDAYQLCYKKKVYAFRVDFCGNYPFTEHLLERYF